MNKLSSNFRTRVLMALALLVPCLLMPGLRAQDNAGPPKDALRFHTLLQKRPFSDTLFERFQEAWLEESTKESLEGFLAAQSGAEAATVADHCLFARFLTEQGREAEALALLVRELREGEGPSEAWMQRARLRAGLADFPKALADLEQATKQDPGDGIALEIGRLQGRYLLRMGKTEEALGAWKSLLEQSPEDLGLREEIIDLMEGEKQLDEAVKLAQSLIEDTKDPYERLTRRLRLAGLLESSGAKEGAIDEYAAILEQAESGSFLEREAISRSEEIFRRDEDVQGWLEQVESLQEAEPNRLALRIERAELLGELGKKAEAVVAWKETLERAPGDFDVRLAYVNALGSMEEFPEAIGQIKRLMEGNQGSKAELEFTLAGFHVGNKQPEMALAALWRFRELEGRNEASYLRSISFLESVGLPDPCRSLFIEAREKWPDSLVLDERWAKYAYDVGEKEEARKVWAKLIAEGDETLALRIADVLLQRKEATAAVAMLEGRLDDFGDNSEFLKLLCIAAVQARKVGQPSDESLESDGGFIPQGGSPIPWARRLVNLVTIPGEVAEATRFARAAIEAYGTADREIAELLGLGAEITFQERRLLAELRDEKLWFELSGSVLAFDGLGDVEQTLSPQALECFRRRQWSDAVEAQKMWLADSERGQPAEIGALVRLLDLCGRINEASSWIAEWKRLAPDRLDPWLAEAAYASAVGRYDDCIKSLQQAVELFPDMPEALARLRGQLYVRGKLTKPDLVFWDLMDGGEPLEDVNKRKSRVLTLRTLLTEDGLLPVWSSILFEPTYESKRFDAYRSAAERYADLVSTSVAKAGSSPMEDLRTMFSIYSTAVREQTILLMDEVVIHRWLTTTFKDADLAEFAVWTASEEAIRLNPYLADTLRALARMPRSTDAVPDDATAVFVSRLDDEKRPLWTRLQMFRFLKDTYQGWPAEFENKVVDFLVESWDRGEEGPSNAEMKLFYQRPMDEEWGKSYERLENGFRRYCLSNPSVAAGKGQPGQELDMLLDCALRRKRYDFAGELIANYSDALFRGFRSNFRPCLQPTLPFLQLVKAGQHDLARGLLKSAPELLGSDKSTGLAWDDALRRQAPVFLQSLDSPAERILAEAVFAKLPGRNPDEARKRMVEMAMEFSRMFDAPITSREGRKVLSLLARSRESREVVRDLLFETAVRLEVRASDDNRSRSGTPVRFGGLPAWNSLDLDLEIFHSAIREAARVGSFAEYRRLWAIMETPWDQNVGSGTDWIRISQLGTAIESPYEEWKTARLSDENLSEIWPIMRFISLQRLPGPGGNLKVPAPEETLRRFLAVTFAANRVADLAAWETEWDGVWESKQGGRPARPMPQILDDLLADPKALVSMLKEAKALCPDRAPDEWSALMERWATHPWLSGKTTIFGTNGPQILEDAGLNELLETKMESGAKK